MYNVLLGEGIISFTWICLHAELSSLMLKFHFFNQQLHVLIKASIMDKHHSYTQELKGLTML